MVAARVDFRRYALPKVQQKRRILGIIIKGEPSHAAKAADHLLDKRSSGERFQLFKRPKVKERVRLYFRADRGKAALRPAPDRHL